MDANLCTICPPIPLRHTNAQEPTNGHIRALEQVADAAAGLLEVGVVIRKEHHITMGLRRAHQLHNALQLTRAPKHS